MDALEPSGSVELIAAALRADSTDISVLASVLSGKLSDALPPDIVEISAQRSMSDRMAKRPGIVTCVRITFPTKVLEVERTRNGGLSARVQTIVRGVTIARQDVSMGEWINVFAEELSKLSTEREGTRVALERFLGLN
ncbi:MAG: hypothetical protein ACP5O0_00920 [Acidimicrobiales bacterium]